ncbi:MAG: hypothetical protein ABJA67_10900, partial [Chthonomonadales bacterium]
MNRDQLIDRTLNIYLQIAESARLSNDASLSHSMLLAAYEQVQNFSQVVNQKPLTKLAELLAMEKLTK